MLTFLFSTGILFRFNIVRGVDYLYSPLNAVWKTEQEVFRRLWATNDENFYPGSLTVKFFLCFLGKDAMLQKGFYIIVTAQNNGNVIHPLLAKEINLLIDWITNTTFTASNNQNYTFWDICLKFENKCFANEQIRFLAEIFSKNIQASYFRIYIKFFRIDSS